MSIQNKTPITLQKSQFATRHFTSIFIFIALATIIYPQNAESLACAGGNNASVADVLSGNCGNSSTPSAPAPVPIIESNVWTQVYDLGSWFTYSYIGGATYYRNALDVLIWSNNQFVGIGDAGNSTNAKASYVSTDGITWTKRNLLPFKKALSLTWTGSYYLMLVQVPQDASYSPVIDIIPWTSSDGVNWQQASALPFSQKTYVGKYNTWTAATYFQKIQVEWTGTGFVALGEDGNETGAYYLATSLDGITWQIQPAAFGNGLHLTQFKNKLFILGNDSSSAIVYSSADNGTTWQQSPAPWALATGNLYQNDSTLFFTPRLNPAQIYSSQDGLTWVLTTVSDSDSTPDFVTWTGSNFIGLRDNHNLWISADGLQWHFLANAPSYHKSSWLNQLPLVMGAGTLVTYQYSNVSKSGGAGTFNGVYTVKVPPMISVPVDLYVTTDLILSGIQASNPVITTFFTDAYANDVLDGLLTVTNDAPSFFGSGTTTKVTFTATNSAGKRSIATANVIVEASTNNSSGDPANITSANNSRVDPTDTSGSSSGGCFSPAPLTQQLFIMLLLLGLRPITWLKNCKWLGNEERNNGAFQ